MNILDNGIHLAHTMSFAELDRCLDLITYNGAKTLSVEDQYGIEVGKPANFLVLERADAREGNVGERHQRLLRPGLKPIPPSRPCGSALTCWHRFATVNTCLSAPTRAMKSHSIYLGRPSEDYPVGTCEPVRRRRAHSLPHFSLGWIPILPSKPCASAPDMGASLFPGIEKTRIGLDESFDPPVEK